MRSLRYAAVLGSWLGALLVSTQASATSCARSPWQTGAQELAVTEDVPVDAHLWLFLGCPWEGFEESCTLESGEDSVEVDVVQGECTDLARLVEVVPRAALSPGRAYELVCSGLDEGEVLGFTTRSSLAPAAPPGEIAVRDAWIEPGGGVGVCCGGPGDWLALVLDGLDAPFYAEGGRVEVAYPDGEIFPVWLNQSNKFKRLPATEGPLLITPVAADGTRGETVRVESSEIAGNEEGCTVARGRSPEGLWLLVPALWIGVERRRRSAA